MCVLKFYLKELPDENENLTGLFSFISFLTVDVNRNVLFREFQCQEKKKASTGVTGCCRFLTVINEIPENTSGSHIAEG